MTTPNIEITDEVLWHEIITNRIIYIEDAGLEGVRWKFIAHVAEFEKPGEEVDNDHLLEGNFEPLWLLCGECWAKASSWAGDEILKRTFGGDDK